MWVCCVHEGLTDKKKEEKHRYLIQVSDRTSTQRLVEEVQVHRG